MQYFYAFECTFETKCPKVEAVLSQCRLPFFSCPALSTFFVQSIDIGPPKKGHKNPSKLKTGLEGNVYLFRHGKAAHRTSFFLFGG